MLSPDSAQNQFFLQKILIDFDQRKIICLASIFAGVLFSLEGLGKYLSWLMISRWSIGAYGVLVEVEAMIAEAKEQNSFNFPLPFEDANQVYQLSINNLLLNWGVLILHSLIYFLLTYWLQKRKDIL